MQLKNEARHPAILHVPKEGSIKPWRDQFEGQLFEAEDLADEDSILVPADIPLLFTRRRRRPNTVDVLLYFQQEIRGETGE